MLADQPIARQIAERQITMFRMFVGPGLLLTREALSSASGIPTSTLKDWAHGSAMPAYGLLILSRFLPHDAINLIVGVVGKRLIEAETIEANWMTLASDSAGVAAEICQASTNGPISPGEKGRLKTLTRKLISEAESLVEEG